MAMQWQCAFASLSSCSHATLFMDSYQRTNRTNRTKIVRCFPHCCPHHRTRSYCCTPVNLVITRDGLGTIQTSDNLQVFARYRPEDDMGIRAQEIIPSSSILSSLQSAQEPSAPWVTSRVVFRSDNMWVFEVNPEAKWLYAWNSGATMAQRLTRHVLEAVVVVSNPDGRMFTVVAVTHSPAFTFTSFRHTAESASPRSDQSSHYFALSRELQEHAFRQWAQYPNVTVEPKIQVPAPQSHEVVTSPNRNEQTEDFDRDLLNLIDWVSQLPAVEVSDVLRHWEASLGRVNLPDSTRFITNAVIPMATHLVWWIHTDRSIRHRLQWHAARTVRELGNPLSLRSAHGRWIADLRQLCDTFLERYGWTWNTLIAATKRTQWTSAPATGFRRFVAIVRQLAIQQVISRRTLHNTTLSTSIWVCGVADVHVQLLHSGQITRVGLVEALSVGAFLVFWTQLQSLQLAFDEHTKCVRVHSPLLLSTMTGLVLILDHKYRCFETLPNGEPTLGTCLPGGYSLGDYIGFRAWSGVAPRLHITLFAWPQGTTTVAYRCHWTVEVPVDQSEAKNALFLHVRLDIGDMSQRRTPETPALETLRLCDKLALVDGWKTQYKGLLPYTISQSN